MMPERLPYDSLQPVAADRQTAGLLGYSQAEPCFLCAIFFVKNRKHLVAAALCFFEDAAVSGRFKKPATPPEAAVLVRA